MPPCPESSGCGDPRFGPFCEQCGYCYATGRSPAWSAVITPDRDCFETAGEAAQRFTFPTSDQPRRVTLSDTTVRIGRHSRSRAVTPEIDLTVPPADPGVSREHARLLTQPDGSWAVIDEGSENGAVISRPSR